MSPKIFIGLPWLFLNWVKKPLTNISTNLKLKKMRATTVSKAKF